MTDLGVYYIKFLMTLNSQSNPIQIDPTFDNTQIKYVKKPGLAADW